MAFLRQPPHFSSVIISDFVSHNLKKTKTSQTKENAHPSFLIESIHHFTSSVFSRMSRSGYKPRTHFNTDKLCVLRAFVYRSGHLDCLFLPSLSFPFKIILASKSLQKAGFPLPAAFLLISLSAHSN